MVGPIQNPPLVVKPTPNVKLKPLLKPGAKEFEDSVVLSMNTDQASPNELTPDEAAAWIRNNPEAATQYFSAEVIAAASNDGKIDENEYAKLTLYNDAGFQVADQLGLFSDAKVYTPESLAIAIRHDLGLKDGQPITAENVLTWVNLMNTDPQTQARLPKTTQKIFNNAVDNAGGFDKLLAGINGKVKNGKIEGRALNGFIPLTDIYGQWLDPRFQSPLYSTRGSQSYKVSTSDPRFNKKDFDHSVYAFPGVRIRVASSNTSPQKAIDMKTDEEINQLGYKEIKIRNGTVYQTLHGIVKLDPNDGVWKLYDESGKEIARLTGNDKIGWAVVGPDGNILIDDEGKPRTGLTKGKALAALFKLGGGFVDVLEVSVEGYYGDLETCGLIDKHDLILNSLMQMADNNGRITIINLARWTLHEYNVLHDNPRRREARMYASESPQGVNVHNGSTRANGKNKQGDYRLRVPSEDFLEHDENGKLKLDDYGNPRLDPDRREQLKRDFPNEYSRAEECAREEGYLEDNIGESYDYQAMVDYYFTDILFNEGLQQIPGVSGVSLRNAYNMPYSTISIAGDRNRPASLDSCDTVGAAYMHIYGDWLKSGGETVDVDGMQYLERVMKREGRGASNGAQGNSHQETARAENKRLEEIAQEGKNALIKLLARRGRTNNQPSSG